MPDIATQRRVLMIGGNRSTIGSIRAIKSAGFQLVLAEKLPRQYAMVEADIGLEISPGDLPGLAAAIKGLGGVDGIIGINETAMKSAALLQRMFALPGLVPEVIASTGSKLAQRQAWGQDPSTSVPFRVVQTDAELSNALAGLGGYPLIVKPDLSHGGSRGVSVVHDAAGVADAFAFAQSHALEGSGVVIERALSGPQFSAELLVHEGRTTVLAIGRKIKSRAPYCVDLAICYPGLTDPAEIAAVEAMCAKATAALGITRGPGHIEFVMTPEGPRPIELGARCGGSLTADLAAHVSGRHPMVEAARLSCGLPPQSLDSLSRHGAVLMFLAFPPGEMAALDIPGDVALHPAVLDVDGRLPDDGVIQPIQWTSQRSGYLGVIAEDGPTALAIAQDMATRIGVVTLRGERLTPLTFA